MVEPFAKIEAAGITTGQQLDWRTETPGLTASSSGQVANVAVQDIDGLPLVQVDEGGELPDAQGYILLPASGGTAAYPLQLQVTTTKDGKGNKVETIIPVSVTVDGGFQPGKTHLVSLFFTGNSAVQISSVRVEAWTDTDVGEWPI